MRALLAVVVLAGCYTPELRDCTVTCASAADCAGDQVCGRDAYCAAPELAGRCADLGTNPDASLPAPDASTPPDAGPMPAMLKVEISGMGRVDVPGHPTCVISPCFYLVAVGQQLALTASPEDDFRFDKWEGAPCANQPAACTATAVAPVTAVKARFKH
jgi:hypothetical protein